MPNDVPADMAVPDVAVWGWGGDIPALNWNANRLTGVGREHWLAVADELLSSIRPYFTPDHALCDLPGSPSVSGVHSDGFEGFARTFLLAALRVAGDAGTDPRAHLEFYRRGLVAGTSDDSGLTAHAWPRLGKGTAGRQPMVESASIALGLQLTRPWLWDALTLKEQRRVEAWLRESLQHEPPPNNWFVFPLMVAGFLESIGHDDEATRAFADRALGVVDGWYRGDGWYSDGDGRAFDHYVGWTLHAFPMLFAFLRSDAALLRRLGPRLHRFLEDFSVVFDATGAPIHQGRSLTYRFATLAAPAVGAVTGFTPLAPGQSRTLMNRTLRYFLERGAVTDGILTRGWLGPHAATAQGYSGPSSPYWAAHGFLALLLPADDPFWRAPEEDPTPEPVTRCIPSVGWLIQRTRDGLVRLHNHGSDHVGVVAGELGASNPLYSRYAYSTRTGPTSASNCSDNDVQLIVGGVGSTRHRIHPLGTGPDWAASWHTPVFSPPGSPTVPQGAIRSLVIAHAGCDIRILRWHVARHDACLRVSGWALATQHPTGLEATTDQEEWGPTVSVVAVPDNLRSELVGLHGFDSAVIERAPAGTAFGDWAVVPALTGPAAGGLAIALVRLTTREDGALPLPDVCSARIDGDTITLAWNDGEHVVDWSAPTPSVTWTTT